MLIAGLLANFRLSNVERRLGVYGVHVYQAGQGEVEHRFRADDRVQVWSVSKTFTALAVGMAIGEGRVSLDDHLLDYFPEAVGLAAPGSEAITPRHLLRMSSGKDYPWFEETDPKLKATTDWAELFFRGTVKSTPGTKFFYANANTYMLGRLVEQVSGLNLRDYLMPRLFDRLEILNPWWNTCPRGHTIGAYGLQLTTSEIAKMGRLLLQDGLWQDQPLVPATYVEAMRTDVVSPNQHFEDPETNVGYGYQIWLNTVPGTFRADGLYGQYSIVVPQRSAVITVTAHNEGPAYNIVRAVFADIVPRL
ncbi:MAG: beta-lactamase family protein [Bifidobacteriaceae bacterium]|jgi:CubicO group peptidase (beta-lactamase class C family)|nr:beta-lactamase family protein [Bifidobacteriaceae bacterium]